MAQLYPRSGGRQDTPMESGPAGGGQFHWGWPGPACVSLRTWSRAWGDRNRRQHRARSWEGPEVLGRTSSRLKIILTS